MQIGEYKGEINLCNLIIFSIFFNFRFIDEIDKLWFQETLQKTAEECLNIDFRYYSSDETYFVNFLRDPPEPTGDEPEDFVLVAPKIYEEIPRLGKN